jgi:hypothetical protein
LFSRNTVQSRGTVGHAEPPAEHNRCCGRLDSFISLRGFICNGSA